jgi:hypothetical protein
VSLLTRRELIVGSVVAPLAGAVGTVNAGFSSPNTIPLRIRGTAGSHGADLALDEVRRTASLLGTSVSVAGLSGAITIDLNAGSLVEAGAASHFVAADASARERALATWRRDHGGQAQSALEWHAGLTTYGAEQLNARFARRFGEPMDASDWISWMLIKVAAESRLRAEPIAAGQYDGHKGKPLTFGSDARLIQPLCIISPGGELLGVVE